MKSMTSSLYNEVSRLEKSLKALKQIANISSPATMSIDRYYKSCEKSLINIYLLIQKLEKMEDAISSCYRHSKVLPLLSG